MALPLSHPLYCLPQMTGNYRERCYCEQCRLTDSARIYLYPFRIYILRRLKHEKVEADDDVMVAALWFYTANTVSCPTIVSTAQTLNHSPQLD